MSQALKFRDNCWIYTKASERDTMKRIIKLLQQFQSLCVNGFVQRMPGRSPHAIRLALFYLVACKLVDVKSKHEVRVFRLAHNWDKRIKNVFISFNKENNNVTVINETPESNSSYGEND